MKISIITVTYNSEKYLEETIRSVIGQRYHDIEYIIIDGGSTDGTLEIISRYRQRISYFTSEPDRNMYDAINKGLARVTGDYIMILNSDDLLVDEDCIKRVADIMGREKADAFVTNLITDYGNGRIKRRRHRTVNFNNLLLSGHGTFLPHPCLFISAATNRQLGGYDITYSFAADYDYILRMLMVPGLRIKQVPVYTTRFRVHQDSITSSGKLDKERRLILEKYGYWKYPPFKRFLSTTIGWLRYLLLNFDNYCTYYFSRSTA